MASASRPAATLSTSRFTSPAPMATRSRASTVPCLAIDVVGAGRHHEACGLRRRARQLAPALRRIGIVLDQAQHHRFRRGARLATRGGELRRATLSGMSRSACRPAVIGQRLLGAHQTDLDAGEVAAGRQQRLDLPGSRGVQHGAGAVADGDHGIGDDVCGLRRQRPHPRAAGVEHHGDGGRPVAAHLRGLLCDDGALARLHDVAARRDRHDRIGRPRLEQGDVGLVLGGDRSSSAAR